MTSVSTHRPIPHRLRFEGFHRFERYSTELAKQEEREWVIHNTTSERDQALFQEAGPPGSGRQISYVLLPNNEAWVFTGSDATRLDFELGLHAQGLKGQIAPHWTLREGSRLNFDLRSYDGGFVQYVKDRIQHHVFPHQQYMFSTPAQSLTPFSSTPVSASENFAKKFVAAKTPKALAFAIQNIHPYLSKAEIQEILTTKRKSLGSLYLKALHGKSRSGAELVSRLLLSEHALDIMLPLAKRLEETMDRLAVEAFESPDNKPVRLHHHPLLAELFLFLNAPTLAGKDREISTLTAAITSIEQLHTYEVKVTGKTVNNWARIGLLTHGFRFWKYDAQGGKDSLLARFGFEPISGRASDATFGPGYLYRMEDTLIEFRRGYLLVSHPDRGTLLIRNSSHIFGRNLMAEPAYYSPTALTEEEIKSLAPTPEGRKLFGFQRILEPRLNQRWGFQNNLDRLLNDLMILKKSFALWKFDPKAFDRKKGFQGDLTPGLKGVLEMAQERLGERELGMSDKPVPALGLFKPNLPPDFSFATYEFTPQNIRELEARLDGSWQEEDFPNSQWTPFVQTAVDKNAEMVLVDPAQET